MSPCSRRRVGWPSLHFHTPLPSLAVFAGGCVSAWGGVPMHPAILCRFCVCPAPPTWVSSQPVIDATLLAAPLPALTPPNPTPPLQRERWRLWPAWCESAWRALRARCRCGCRYACGCPAGPAGASCKSCSWLTSSPNSPRNCRRPPTWFPGGLTPPAQLTHRAGLQWPDGLQRPA